MFRRPRIVYLVTQHWRLIFIWLLLIGLASFAAVVPSSLRPLATKRAPTAKVSRGRLLVSVTEQGTVESSHNTEIKCEIRGGYGGRGGMSTVTWVVPSGSVVEKGEPLVRLDTKVIEETISLGKTDTNIAKAQLARTQADVAKASIAIDAYLNGRYRSQMEVLENDLSAAKRNLNLANKTLANSQSLFEQGFVTQLEVEGSEFAVEQAKLELDVKKTEIDVLERLTKVMELETLNGQLVATKARLQGRKAGLVLEQSRLDLAMKEFEKSTIHAPQGGLVIYPSTAKWKETPDITEGASVHNNQVLLLMPDLTQMQVIVGIHESIIQRVKPGLPVKVTLSDDAFESTVHSVASVASPAGWWSGNTVRYDTLVQLPVVDENGTKRSLKPGMTASVKVVLAEYDNVLMMPLDAVLETETGRFCWVISARGIERRTLQLGDSNDQYVIVESGIKEAESVIVDPLKHVKEARSLAGTGFMQPVKRGDLLVTLTEQGTLESSNSTKVKCRVRGASTINWVVESGTRVQAGDELVRLENKQIEEHLHERTKFAYLSKDAAIGFRAQATRAGLAIQEYLEGRFRTELLNLEKELAILRANLRSAQNMLVHTKTVAQSGYVSALELREKEFAVTRAQLAVEAKQDEIEVLQDHTKSEQLTALRGEWAAAKAAANGHEEVLAMDEQRIALARKEMEHCVVRAERDGLVIYPTSQEWKRTPDIAEGATVHKDQLLLLMPDLRKMQVKVGVHESVVELVKPGMRAHVRLPDRELEGTVTSVAAAAQPSGWWTGNLVKYDTIIELPTADGLMPGMSAEVEIVLGEHQDVVMVPVAAVVETEKGTCCWVGNDDSLLQREVTVGVGNDEFVLVESGLEVGDVVIVAPAALALGAN